MIKIGVICPSEIAFRRFLPALQQDNDFLFIGVAIASPEEWFGEAIKNISSDIVDKQQSSEREKALSFINLYGGRIFDSYAEIINSQEVDAIYVPLPPALHYKWSKLAIERGKHVFVEKPATTDSHSTADVITMARKNKLVLHENYMFIFHNQIKALKDIVESGEIGNIYLYRISFGFPRRAINDFRYNKELGGGALIDAGGYTLKYASYLLGKSTKILCASLKYIDDFEVDIFGSATLVNDDGLVVQVAFGMDNDYKCDVEMWGSKGSINSNRILTAPSGFIPHFTIKKNQEYHSIELPEDDAFLKSINFFKECIFNEYLRTENYDNIQRQADLVSEFKRLVK